LDPANRLALLRYQRTTTPEQGTQQTPLTQFTD